MREGMASSLLVRAREALRRNAHHAKRVAKENEKTIAFAAGGASSLGAAVGAAFADQKMGEGRQWKVGPVPVVAIFGVGALIPAFFTAKYPVAQAVSVQTGMTLINIAGYRWLVEEGIEQGQPSAAQ
jgi:hypothetical protein